TEQKESMKKLSLLLFAVALLFTACNKSNKQSSNKQNQVAIGQGANSATNISGVYSGTLPCADCPGIKTTLTFEPNNKVKKSTFYLGHDSTEKTTKGSYKIDMGDSLIIVNIPNEKKKFYRMKSDTTIAMLKSDTTEVKGPLAKKYILTKENR